MNIEQLLRLHNQGIVREIGSIRKHLLSKKYYGLYSIEAPADSMDAPTVLLTAGIHGNEPASVDALLEFFEEGIFQEYSEHISFQACACLNPIGYEKDIHKNARFIRRININRDFIDNHRSREAELMKGFLSNPHKRYMGVINLHEDNVYESEGRFRPSDSPRAFYLYETSKKEHSIGPDIIGFLSSQGIGTCKKNKVYHDHCEDGVIWTPLDAPPDEYMPATLEEFLSINKHSEHVLTFETPTCWSHKKRVETHHLASCYALDYFREKAKEMTGDLHLKR